MAELATGLAGLGAIVREITVYRTLPDVAAIRKAKGNALVEPTGCYHFHQLVHGDETSLRLLVTNGVPLRAVKIACIGPKTAQTAAASRTST